MGKGGVMGGLYILKGFFFGLWGRGKAKCLHFFFFFFSPIGWKIFRLNLISIVFALASLSSVCSSLLCEAPL